MPGSCCLGAQITVSTRPPSDWYDDDVEDDVDASWTDGVPGARRSWVIGGLLTTVVFVAVVVLSTRSASVPVGESGSMAGMSMGAEGRVAVTMRDVNERVVRLPDGRPSVVVFVSAPACDICVAAVRAAGDAVRQTTERAQLVVVMADAATSRADVDAITRSVGRSPARYVIDDRNSRLASMLGASNAGSAVVYDARGQVIAHPETNTGTIAAALRRADR